MIDIDRIYRLRSLRLFAGIGTLTCLVGVAMTLAGVMWPAAVILTVGALVFFVHVMNYSADLHTMKIAQPTKRKGGTHSRG